jgi:hypothetical protein
MLAASNGWLVTSGSVTGPAPPLTPKVTVSPL